MQFISSLLQAYMHHLLGLVDCLVPNHQVVCGTEKDCSQLIPDVWQNFSPGKAPLLSSGNSMPEQVFEP
jgi:hypothetical protein